MKDREGALLEAFVGYLESYGHPGLRIEERPDHQNRVGQDIDALAGPYAIEHTTIDASPDQRQKEHRFQDVVGGLGAQCSASVGARLNILFEYGAVRPGQDWPTIRQALKDWLLETAPALADGRHTAHLPGVPFPLFVRKVVGRKPGVAFGVMHPKDPALATRLYKQLGRKSEKLRPYKKAGRHTILLLESSDLALMNEVILTNAIHQAFGAPTPPAVDAVWYADSSIPDEILFTELAHEAQ